MSAHARAVTRGKPQTDRAYGIHSAAGGGGFSAFSEPGQGESICDQTVFSLSCTHYASAAPNVQDSRFSGCGACLELPFPFRSAPAGFHLAVTVSPAPDSTIARDAAADPESGTHTPDAEAASADGTSLRQIVEAVACLAVAVIVFRAFVLEGYIISTGSMAPSLLGYHKQVQCPDCGFKFAFGTSDALRSDPSAQVANCPNCRLTSIDVSRVPRNDGDQLLVLKNAWLTEFAPFVKNIGPNRWDVVVFLNPNDPSQAYVKRAIGLPGEAIQIRDGDIFVNGQRQRKSIETQRAIRVPVFDNDFPSQSPHWIPAWSDPSGDWLPSGRGFVSAKVTETTAGHQATVLNHIAWLNYQHWSRSTRQTAAALRDPVPISIGPVTDRYGYNRRSARVDHVRTHDLMLTAKIDWQPGEGLLAATIRNRDDLVACVLNPSTNSLALLFLTGSDANDISFVLLNEFPQAEPSQYQIAARLTEFQWPLDLEFSVFDRQATIAINGEVQIQQPLPEPAASTAWADRGEGSSGFMVAGQHSVATTVTPDSSPVRIGVVGGTVRVDSLRLFRDVHYTAEAGQHATRDPLQLGTDEFFMLGDNSPVSLDSRSWPSPVVPRRLLIGKPLVVHLPSRPGRLRIGDRVTHIRVPDFSRMRYIR